MNLQGYPEKSSYYQRGKSEGKAEGEVRALFAFLRARGLELSDELRARVLATADLTLLETWIARAATAATVGDIFAPATK